MTGHFKRLVRIVAVVALAGLALGAATACGKPTQPGGLPPAPSTSSGGNPTPSTSPSPSLTPPVAVTTGTAEEQIDAQTRSFITKALPQAYVAPASRRRGLLEPVAMEPAIGIYLNQMSALDQQNQEQRVEEQIISLTIQRSGSTALANTCVDSTKGGLFDKKTNRQLTRGVPREVLLFTLKSEKNVWKVSGTSAKGQKC
ncbi:hypothetical protein GCM10009765_70270 [Fodinicola feengrottensis]|uniref:Lipoprotein n=1 Tax=Fodinicola feengrottensis TaxID=435914 RepID=A0ABN2ISJ8_9ACTN